MITINISFKIWKVTCYHNKQLSFIKCKVSFITEKVCNIAVTALQTLHVMSCR